MNVGVLLGWVLTIKDSWRSMRKRLGRTTLCINGRPKHTHSPLRAPASRPSWLVSRLRLRAGQHYELLMQSCLLVYSEWIAERKKTLNLN